MKHLNIKSLGMMQIVTVIILILSAQVFAGNSWLNKGSSLLKSLGGGEKIGGLSTEEIGSGLKEALRVGSENVVKQLGTTDGFNTDSNIHIPLPGSLKKVKSWLSKIGKASLFEDLELKLNRAAEAATPKAKELFSNAITSLTMEDVKGIYDGPDDAATQYFKGKMSPDLSKEMKPIIDETLSEVGAIKSYDNMIKQYKSIPFVPDVKADLTDHVVEKGRCEGHL